MPEREEMLGSQHAAEEIVVGAGGQPDARHVLNRQHEGHALAADPAQGGTVAESRGGHDHAVDTATQ